MEEYFYLLPETIPPPLHQANNQLANCSPQQPCSTHSIDEDMDTPSVATAKCPNATTGNNSEATLANGLTAEPEEFEITTDYSIKLGAGKQVRKYQTTCSRS